MGKKVLRSYWRRLPAACLLFAAALVAGCSTDSITEALEEEPIDRAAVVLNVGDRTVSVIPFGNQAPTRTYSVATPGAGGGPGSASGPLPVPLAAPTDMAVLGARALVSAGTAVAVMNLATGVVERTISLGVTDARGTVFVGDTMAVSASPGLKALVFFNPATGRISAPTRLDGGEPVEIVRFPAGPAPAGLLVLQSAPVGGNASVTVLNDDRTVRGRVQLTGSMPRAMIARGTLLYVIQGAGGDAPRGGLSIVDVNTLRETSFIPGLGEAPESLAFDSRGELYIAHPGKGVIVFLPATQGFLHGPDAPLTTGGLAEVTRLAADPAGFVYALQPGTCERAGALMLLSSAGTPVATAATGICPADLEFTSLARS